VLVDKFEKYKVVDLRISMGNILNIFMFRVFTGEKLIFYYLGYVSIKMCE